MLRKTAKPLRWKLLKKGAAILFVGEAICFAISYGVWHQVNTSRDFRKYLNDNYPSLLHLYYKVGETFDSNSQIRQIDYAYWEAKSH